MTLKYIWRSFSLGCHFHVHFSYPWHAFASHGLPAIAELLVFLLLRVMSRRKESVPLKTCPDFSDWEIQQLRSRRIKGVVASLKIVFFFKFTATKKRCWKYVDGGAHVACTHIQRTSLRLLTVANANLLAWLTIRLLRLDSITQIAWHSGMLTVLNEWASREYASGQYGTDVDRALFATRPPAIAISSWWIERRVAATAAPAYMVSLYAAGGSVVWTWDLISDRLARIVTHCVHRLDGWTIPLPMPAQKKNHSGPDKKLTPVINPLNDSSPAPAARDNARCQK